MGGLSSCSSFFLVATTALFAILVQQNPLLFGRKVAAKGDGSNNSYRIYTHNTVLEQHLEPFRQAMGETEYVAYKNHCLRAARAHFCSAPLEGYIDQRARGEPYGNGCWRVY